MLGHFQMKELFEIFRVIKYRLSVNILHFLEICNTKYQSPDTIQVPPEQKSCEIKTALPMIGTD